MTRMLRPVANGFARPVRGIGIAVRARPKAFLAVTAGVFVLSLFLPVIVLSLARKPWDYFTFNPWLSRLPEYLASSEVPLKRNVEFLSNLALFWFSGDGPYGSPEWGYVVDVRDLGRIASTSLLVGAYFALWLYRRDQLTQRGWGTRASGHGGMVGALASMLGFSTGPCSVIGCGAPVLPVIGLAFTGLSSGTLTLLAQASRVGTAVVLITLTLGVACFGWLVSARPGDSGSTLATR